MPVTAIAAVLLFLFTGCTLLPSEEETNLARERFRQGEAALTLRDYHTATAAFEEAWRLDATTPLLPLRLGVAREHLKRFPEAAAVYERGIRRADPNDPLRHELLHRLALLDAFRLDRPERVKRLLREVPADSVYAADLRGVVALLAGDGRQALIELNTARSYHLTEEMASTILYHAARAYALIGDRDRALLTLYEAINLAAYTPVMHDIAEFKAVILAK